MRKLLLGLALLISSTAFASDSVVHTTRTETLTNKTIDTASNTVKIAGTSITAISGNTATVASTSGSFTSGNCVKTDANHNLVDNGGTCGGGGGSSAGTTGDVQMSDGASGFSALTADPGPAFRYVAADTTLYVEQISSAAISGGSLDKNIGLTIFGGTPTGTDTGAPIYISSGGGGSTGGKGGRIDIVTGSAQAGNYDGGILAITAGNGFGSGAGGEIDLNGGSGDSGDGGSILLSPGSSTSGAAGTVQIYGDTTSTGKITSSRSTDIGWSVQAHANQACNTTCTSACVFGFDTALGGTDLVDCADTTADRCVCAGAS